MTFSCHFGSRARRIARTLTMLPPGLLSRRMEWLGKKMYPKARAYERRSRMLVFYFVAGIVVFAAAGVGAALWLLNQPHHR